MSGPDDQDLIQWRDALHWLVRAAEDIRAARVLLRENITLQAAFHLQQAIEKVLKALLVAARQDVRKTHNLATLSALSHRHWPNLIGSPFPLSYITRWYIIARYPDEDEAGPTDEEIRMALPDIEALFASAIKQVPAVLASEAHTIMVAVPPGKEGP